MCLAACGRVGFEPIAASAPDGGDDSSIARTCFVEIGVGDDHACARHEDGSVWCWGRNNQGNLGIGSVGGPDLQPARVQGGPFSRLAVGAAHNCVILGDSSVQCWGNDGNRALGPNGSGSDSGMPTLIPNLVTSEIHLAGSYACARVGASYRCWGDADAGQLGDGVKADNRVGHAPISDPVAAGIAVGEDTGCVFLGTGVRCWGINADGQLATPAASTTDQCKDSRDNTNQPCSLVGVMLPSFSTGVKQVALGRTHTCAIDLDDDVWCWGGNQGGQLGDGTTIVRATPMRVSGLPKARSVVAGAFHTCAQLLDATVSCWGEGISGELGDGQLARRLVPGAVPGLSGVTQIALASAGRMTCALDSYGVSCWGDNPYEVAGTTTGTKAEIPQRVLSGCP